MNAEQEIRRIKKRTARGCLIWFLVILSIPAGLIGYFVYVTTFKETTLLISHSPNDINMIKVAQKGEAAFFGPSKVRIHFGPFKYKDRLIANDGGTLHSSNISVSWKNDDEATVTLYGDEQEPETVDIHFSG